MAPLEAVPDIAQLTVTQAVPPTTLTQSTIDFSQPTSIRPGPKLKVPITAPIRRSSPPAIAIVNATNAANEATLLRQVSALPVQYIDSINNSGDHITRKRRSYPRELKLAIVQWALSTYTTQKDGSKKLITQYEAAQRMDITQKVLKDWIDHRDRIARQKKRSRRGILKPKKGQEDKMELRLYAEFKAARATGQQISMY
jgi:transposase-like protein